MASTEGVQRPTRRGTAGRAFTRIFGNRSLAGTGIAGSVAIYVIVQEKLIVNPSDRMDDPANLPRRRDSELIPYKRGLIRLPKRLTSWRWVNLG